MRPSMAPRRSLRLRTSLPCLLGAALLLALPGCASQSVAAGEQAAEAGATAQVAQDAARQPSFEAWLADLKAEARGRGISQATLDAAFAGIEAPIERVVELDRSQPEFTLTFWNYFNRAVSDQRVATGQELYARHRALLDRVEAARTRKMPIASHVPLSLTADEAGPPVDSMEHLRNIDLACAADWESLLAVRRKALDEYEDGKRGYFLRRGLHESQRYASIANTDHERCQDVIESLSETMQVPTLRLNAFNHARPHERDDWRGAAAAMPGSVWARWEATRNELRSPDRVWDLRFADWSLDLVGRLHAAGVPIAAGTDTPIRLSVPGESLHRELELLVESGLSPREALAAATIEPAKFLGLESEMGTVAPGMKADLVLLSGNPLENIRNTRTIVEVIAGGRILSRPR